ncbi:MAG: HEAT repeat domain-containing protein [Planctomycetes bacterium]|nr:HEAT repeat domain-containing protein [Planctomycetota bacterium]
MADPVEKTLRHLAVSSYPQVPALLLYAVDHCQDRVRSLSVEALLRRPSLSSQLELIRRYSTLGTETQKVVLDRVDELKQSLEQTILHGGEKQTEVACGIVLAAGRCEYMLVLLQRLTTVGKVTAEPIQTAFLELVERLSDQVRNSRNNTGHRLASHNLPGIAEQTLVALDADWPGVADRELQEDLWRAILNLGHSDDPAVKRILMQADEDVRERSWELLATSTQTGIMHLLCEFLASGFQSARILEIIAVRRDPQFIAFLLRSFPQQPSTALRNHLSQITKLPWLGSSSSELEQIPPGLHSRLISFVKMTGLAGEAKIRVYEWISRCGDVDARLSAAEALSFHEDGALENMLYASLKSDDEEVQAWATSQLREQAVPDSMRLLVEQLDSDSELVQAAAREELHSFDLYQLLELFEDISPTACLKAGRLVQKIDSETNLKLSAELRNPIRNRRIRAAKAAQALGLHRDVLPDLLALLRDSDVIIQLTVAEILGDIPETKAKD